MNQKSILRLVLTCLVVLMLAANAASVAASPEFSQSSGKVFIVTPSGGDDTAKIQQAFDKAVKAGPGSTVKLAAGNYHTRFIEVWDFDGTFVGAGQNKTIIDTFADQDCQALVDNNRMPALFHFFRGNVRVSDLGFHITPATPCKPFLFGGYNVPDYYATWINTLYITASPFVPESDCAVVKKEKVSGSITRVTVNGEAGVPQYGETEPFFSNLGITIALGGAYTPKYLWDTACPFFLKLGEGTFSIKDSTVRKAQMGFNPGAMLNSNVLISGNSFETGDTGFFLSDNAGSKFEVVNNHIKKNFWSGIWVYQGDASTQPFITTPTVYDIHHNDSEAHLGGGWYGNGVVGFDFNNIDFPSAGKTAVMFIRNNRITLNPLNVPEAFYVHGVMLEGIDDSLVANNIITGTGGTAIYAGSFLPSKRVMVLGNDLTGFSPYASDPYKIVLEWGTEKYVVVGEPVANVANYGTDNLIAGTRFQTPRKSGLSMPDDLKQLLAAMKNLKGGLHIGKR